MPAPSVVPPLINYQGMLTDPNGNPLPTAEHALSFSIYDNSSGGKLLWGPQTFPRVPVVRGYYNVILGPTDGKNRDITNVFITKNMGQSSANTFLEVTVDNNPPVKPRQRILSMPYAVQSQEAQEAVTALQAVMDYAHVPVGSIIAWHKSLQGSPVLQDGWVECNGQTVSDPASPYNGKNVPNLNGNRDYADSKGNPRGLFLRGGAASGTYQKDTVIDHKHTYIYDKIKFKGGDAQIDSDYEYALNNDVSNLTLGVNGIDGDRISDETRPVNMSVVWIMRIK